jgi:succinate dehydrogenase/fumarate reductase flavoprotein subunit
VDCETGVPGLYAAGECAGGVHGAARLGGDGLGEAIIFGARAGRAAARYSCQAELPPAANVPAIIDYLRGVVVDDGGEGGREKIRKIKERLQSVMWGAVSILRNGKDLEQAAADIALIEKEIGEVRVDTLRKLKELLEARNMVMTASFMSNAALMRKESRGGHFRTDYPFRDDKNWFKNILVKKSDAGFVSYSTRDIDDSKYPRLEFSKFGLEVRK